MNSFRKYPTTGFYSSAGYFDAGQIVPPTADVPSTYIQATWMYPSNQPPVYADAAGTKPVTFSTQVTGDTVWSTATSVTACFVTDTNRPTTYGSGYALTRLS